MMTTLEFLECLGMYSRPLGPNHLPGLSPIWRFKGQDYLNDWWYAKPSEAEQNLRAATVALMNPRFTKAEHFSFRLALRECYREQGFTEAELHGFFDDLEVK